MCDEASFCFDFASIARPYSVSIPAMKVFVARSAGSLGFDVSTRTVALRASATTSASVASPRR